MKPFSARGAERKLAWRKNKDENFPCWDHIDEIVKFFGDKMTLILKRKWYDKLLSGEKKEDYRESLKKLHHHLGEWKHLEVQNEN